MVVLSDLKPSGIEKRKAETSGVSDESLRHRETGARALRAVMDELMLDMMYDLPDYKHEGATFIIDSEAVLNGTNLQDLPVREKKESA